MMRVASLAFSLGLALAAGCGNSTSQSGPTEDAGDAGGIPDPGPGSQVDVAFNNVPPNDSPELATPLGTSSKAVVDVWIVNNTIGGTNPANYFVFRSGPADGEFFFDGCFMSPVTSMTATLWTVVDGQPQLPPVGTWNSTGGGDAGQEGCLSMEKAPLTANTVYLFGLTATGGVGTYAL